MTEQKDIEDGLRVMLTIKTDERFSKGVAIGEKKIEMLAADVVKNQEDYDDYRIITGTGQTISPTEIFVNNSVLIDSLGKSVKRDKAWDELSGFYKTLNKTGVLEQ
jgi:hypothetical protein